VLQWRRLVLLRHAGESFLIQILVLVSYPESNAAGESNDGVLKLDFDRHLMLQFRGSMVTSDAGLLVYWKLGNALGLTEMAIERLTDTHSGRNGRHALVGLSRQLVFGRLAGYEPKLKISLRGKFARLFCANKI
jgi:hypothetical protein